MKITSIVDTEQTIIRRFSVDAETDGSEDFESRYGCNGRKYRPVEVRLMYRVNRGATSPYWYVYDIRVTGQQVLKSGKLSDAYTGQHTISYIQHEAPEWLKPWLLEMRPETVPEIRDRRV